MKRDKTNSIEKLMYKNYEHDDDQNILCDRRIPRGRVALVDGINIASLRASNVRVRQNELSDRRIQSEAVQAIASSHHDLCTATVQTVTRGHQFVARLQQVGDRAHRARRALLPEK